MSYNSTMENRRIRTLIVDDRRGARDALRTLLATWQAVQVIGEADNADSAVQQVASLRPEVVIMDARMPITVGGSRHDAGGIEALKNIRHLWPDTQVIVLSLYGDFEGPALAAGASAFVLKGSDPAQLVRAVSRAASHNGEDGGSTSDGSERKAKLPKKNLFQTHWSDIRKQIRQRYPRRIKPEDLDRIEGATNRRAALCRLLAERCDELDESSANKEVDAILRDLSIPQL